MLRIYPTIRCKSENLLIFQVYGSQENGQLRYGLTGCLFFYAAVWLGLVWLPTTIVGAFMHNNSPWAPVGFFITIVALYAAFLACMGDIFVFDRRKRELRVRRLIFLLRRYDISRVTRIDLPLGAESECLTLVRHAGPNIEICGIEIKGNMRNPDLADLEKALRSFLADVLPPATSEADPLG